MTSATFLATDADGACRVEGGLLTVPLAGMRCTESVFDCAVGVVAVGRDVRLIPVSGAVFRLGAAPIEEGAR